MNDLAAQISNKSEDSSQQARIPAPATHNIGTTHDVDAQKLAHAPSVDLESDHSTLRLGNPPGNEDLNPKTSGEQADEKKFFHKPFFYKLIGVLVISVIVGTVLGLTLSDRASQPGTTPAPTPTPTPAPTSLQRDFIIPLIQSRIASISFSNSSSPQSQALDWILADPYSSENGLSEDRLVQRFAMATFWYSTNSICKMSGVWLNSTNECVWDLHAIFCSPEFKVERLFAYGACLSGRIPIELGLFTQLNTFHLFGLRGNQLTGSLPSELGLLTQLTRLVLLADQLTGSLPSELGLLTQLTDLSLSGNQLTGSFPSELGLLTHLLFLHLSDNELTGSLPSEVGLLTQMSSLMIWKNQLMGSIPSQIGLLTQLTRLMLLNNQLTGSIPSQIGLLTQLTRLNLDINQLTGSIPSELGLLTQELHRFDLHTNRLTGSLPSELGLMTLITEWWLYDNDLTGSVPFSLCSALEVQIDCGEIACTCCISGIFTIPRGICPSP
jgi:hypothetical protein